MRFEPRNIGEPIDGFPWITDLTIVDLDGDGLLDVAACEGRLNQVIWFRQTAPGACSEQVIGEAVAGPAHVTVVDLDQDGDLDLLVAAMGIVTPSNEKTGAVVVLENLGDGGSTIECCWEARRAAGPEPSPPKNRTHSMARW